MPEVSGNTTGLGPGQIRMLERVYRRRVPPAEVVGAELAGFLCECAEETGRQVGVLVDRRGAVEHVVVGDASRIFLPDVGRLRAARGRFRGLRLVHTHLRGEPLSQDDLTDLALLRLDLVAAIAVERGGRAGSVQVAHLVPEGGGSAWRLLPAAAPHQLGVDFSALIRALEEEFARTADRLAATDFGLDRALLVHASFGKRPDDRSSRERYRDDPARVVELVELCRSARVKVLGTITQHRPEPDPRYLVGKGKLEQILVRAMQLGAEVLVFDPDLSPGQARSISDFTDVKVVDRTMLILDIFAQRAKSREGKLQVELAQLRYRQPRLVEKNTMMSRLTGGIGGRGPGETKLEINRRRARERIGALEDGIEAMSKHRQLRRKRRGARDVPVASIVGYTNAGKSTLFNALCGGDAYVADLLFATLDPTSRRLVLPPREGREAVAIVLSDTVGFIRDLPPDLARAFRATLEELDEADLLVHIVDAADPDFEGHITAVLRILAELGLAEKRRLLVLSKADLLAPAERERVARERPEALVVSAREPATLRPLIDRMTHELWQEGFGKRADEAQVSEEEVEEAMGT